MNKAVMLSIQPKWCELIASGTKTIEVRKNRPQIETPFKCYIYETKGKSADMLVRKDSNGESVVTYNNGKGRVIGEFICDKIETYVYDEHIGYPTPAYDGDDSFCDCGEGYWITSNEIQSTCLTSDELLAYGNGKNLYGWHISDLVIYDKPRELGEFWVRSNHPDCDLCAHVPVDMSPDEFVWHNDFCGECHRLSYKSMWATHFRKRITRAPQSWMYCQPIEAN